MGLLDGTAGWLANGVSQIGQNLNLPTIFDWDTDAARSDAANGVKRSASSAAGKGIAAAAAAPAFSGANYSKGGDLFNSSFDFAGNPIDQSMSAIASDPYAAYGGASAYNALRSGFVNQKNNVYSSALDSARALEGGYNQNILDTIYNLTQSQNSIDKQRVQNEAAKIQGTRDVTDMVGRGIRSGGVQLANRNAGNSSAAQAIANAYGDLGTRELSKVGNQYASNNSDIDTAQTDLAYQLQQAPERFRTGLMQNVDNIVSQARDQLSSLDAAMANASLPDRLAIDQERQSIKDQVLGVLGQYGDKLAQGVGGIQAAGADDIRSRASQQLSAGQAPANAFNYTTEAPASLQGTGPYASELPIFTYNRKSTDY